MYLFFLQKSQHYWSNLRAVQSRSGVLLYLNVKREQIPVLIIGGTKTTRSTNRGLVSERNGLCCLRLYPMMKGSTSARRSTLLATRSRRLQHSKLLVRIWFILDLLKFLPMSGLVSLCPFCLLWSYLVSFVPSWLLFAPLGPFWSFLVSFWSLLVPLGPFQNV